MSGKAPLDCVVFILAAKGAVLAERRKADPRLLPGILSLPGGHVDAGESLAEALTRELAEELSIAGLRPRFICTLLHQAEEWRALHYFAIEAWTGDIQCHEAESLHWVPLDRLDRFDLDVDREAIGLYLHSPPAGGEQDQ